MDQDLEKTRALEKAKFKAADADGDDLLNLQEMASLFYLETSPAVLDVVVRDTLKLKDKNKDGVLNVKEFWDFGPENAGEKIKEEEMRVFRQLDKEIWISPRFTAVNPWWIWWETPFPRSLDSNDMQRVCQACQAYGMGPRPFFDKYSAADPVS